MLKSQAVAQYLPFLRRYARALTGSQTSGDAYVSATLEALIEDPTVIDDSGRPAGRALSAVHEDLEFGRRSTGAKPLLDADMPADMRLASLTPLPRQAFLLVALEGFSEEDAARDSGCRRRDAALAGRRIRPRARRRDRDRCPDHRGRDLHRDGPRDRWSKASATACSASPAPTPKRSRIAREEDARPDPRRHPARRRQLGPRCRQRAAASFEVPVIFITAYPERFLTGERPEPAFLIAKPFQPAMVSAIASQALFFARNARRRRKRPRIARLRRIDRSRHRASVAPREQSHRERADAHRDRERDQRPLLDLARRACATPRCRAASRRRRARATSTSLRARGRGCAPPISSTRRDRVADDRSITRVTPSRRARRGAGSRRASRASNHRNSRSRSAALAALAIARTSGCPLARCLRKRNGRPTLRPAICAQFTFFSQVSMFFSASSLA